MLTKESTMKTRKPKKSHLPRICHCGSGKFPCIMKRDGGWCCAECHNHKHYCENSKD
jgi:hypothetical protein